MKYQKVQRQSSKKYDKMLQIRMVNSQTRVEPSKSHKLKWNEVECDSDSNDEETSGQGRRRKTSNKKLQVPRGTLKPQ